MKTDQKNKNTLKNNWTSEEWKKMVKNLQKLNENQLKTLATRVGIEFKNGNIMVQDTKNASVKEQFILVLDETPKETLLKEYQKICKN